PWPPAAAASAGTWAVDGRRLKRWPTQGPGETTVRAPPEHAERRARGRMRGRRPGGRTRRPPGLGAHARAAGLGGACAAAGPGRPEQDSAVTPPRPPSSRPGQPAAARCAEDALRAAGRSMWATTVA